MGKLHAVVRIGTVSTLLTAGLAAGLGAADAQSPEPSTPSGGLIAQGLCFDTDPSHPNPINPLACLVSLLTSGSGSGSTK
ncbi:hypothetical protein [Nocardia sp. NPDC056100]|uniref:hypothetical protein n=1 Tax=Nocardia sp. NPDC056100 TaxID=3345712 RepID=UPI0035D8090D